MALSDDEIDVLRESLHRLQTRKALAAAIFYETLFRIEPSLRPMFEEDIGVQTEKVLFAFGAVVAQIHNLEVCREMTRELALRHLDYGVRPEHYAFVGEAVMATVAAVLEDAFTPEVERTWRRAYDQISGAMIASAYGETSAA